jgi:2,3,4,5-tetrahydropyridine-2-carboxylate N-succinyltransferase
MEDYITTIEELWQSRDNIFDNTKLLAKTKDTVNEILEKLNNGYISVCEKRPGGWYVNEWIKKAILLHFKISSANIYDGNCMRWYDKIDPKFINYSVEDFQKTGARIVPGSFVRKGAYVGKNTVIMPSFINIGAHVGDGTLIDTWATVGSCAYIGKNCHISGGTGIGGVLEPLQAKPVIVEDNCFIGARSEIVEGVIVEEGAVVSMGVFIGASTKIINRETGEVTFGRVPAYSVVVPGTAPSDKPGLPGLYCAVIIKQVDKKTRDKTGINELLRE